MKKLIRTLCLLGIGLFSVSEAVAQVVPQEMPYQGRVLVQGTNFTGSGNFKFVLMNTAGTVTYWSNDGTSVGGAEPAAGVPLPVDRGLFGLLLGDTGLANMNVLPSSVFTNTPLVLRVWFDDGATGYQQLSPDQALGAIGYAHMAAFLEGGQADANDVTNELNQGLSFVGDQLQLTDSGGSLNVDFSAYLRRDGSLSMTGDLDMAQFFITNAFYAGDGSLLTNLAAGLISDVSLNNTTLSVTESGTEWKADLVSLVDDADPVQGNELVITATLQGNVLVLEEGDTNAPASVIHTVSVDLATFSDAAAIAAASNALTAVDNAIMATTTANRAATDAASNALTVADAAILSGLSTASNALTAVDNAIMATTTANRAATDAASNALNAADAALDTALATASNSLRTSIDAHVLADGDLADTNELNQVLAFLGDDLQLTDPGGTLTADLSAYLRRDGSLSMTGDLDMADFFITNAFYAGDGSLLTNLAAGLISDVSLNSTTLSVTESGTEWKADLISLVDDADPIQGNELVISATLQGNVLVLEEGDTNAPASVIHTVSVDLATFSDAAAIAAASNALTAVDNAIMATTTANRAATDAASNALNAADAAILTGLATASNALTAVDAAILSGLATASNALTSVDAAIMATTTANRAATDAVSNALTAADAALDLALGTASNALRTSIDAHVTADGDLFDTNELNQVLEFVGDDLQLTDPGGTLNVDLSAYLRRDGSLSMTGELDMADFFITNAFYAGDGSLLTNLPVGGGGTITDVSLNSTTLSVTEAAMEWKADLVSLVDDADANQFNELLISVELNGGSLVLVEGIGGTNLSPTAPFTVVRTNIVDLSALDNSADIIAASNSLSADIIAASNSLSADIIAASNSLFTAITNVDQTATNEYINDLALSNNVLLVYDASPERTNQIDLSSLVGDADDDRFNELIITATIVGNELLLYEGIAGTNEVPSGPFTIVRSNAVDITSLQSAGPSIRGVVSGAGTITSGTGFSVVRNSAGNYTVTFTVPFSGAPGGSVTPVGASRLAARIATLNTTSFNVIFETTTNPSTATDTAFTFIFMAP